MQQALSGAALPGLDTVFTRLADHVQAHLEPALLKRQLGA